MKGIYKTSNYFGLSYDGKNISRFFMSPLEDIIRFYKIKMDLVSGPVEPEDIPLIPEELLRW